MTDVKPVKPVFQYGLGSRVISPVGPGVVIMLGYDRRGCSYRVETPDGRSSWWDAEDITK